MDDAPLPLYEHDAQRTRANRERLHGNRNLLLWYERLYQELFRDVPDIASRRILEIGSGTSPLKGFLPNVLTSDVLALDYLDLVFDCHRIDELAQVPDGGLDIITLTNVLHHLRDPLLFLRRATRKLAPGGSVYLVEPYFSALSWPLYKLLHPEPVDFSVRSPMLDAVAGPLSSANQAIPHMLFFRRADWLGELADVYDLERTRVDHYTSLAYMATGGISRTFSVPHALFRRWLAADIMLARRWPSLFASFFCARLTTPEAA